jgi:hypothetical protein
MDGSTPIAAVLGSALLALTVSKAINLKIWDGVDSTVVYLNSLMFLVGGLVGVTTHNLWQLNLRLLVTISGWLLVIAGAFRMFFPESPKLAAGFGTYLVIAVLFSLGIVLTRYAFQRRTY